MGQWSLGKSIGGDKGYQVDEMLDPLRLFHDAKAIDAPNLAQWNALQQKSEALAAAGPNANQTGGWNATVAAANDGSNTQLLQGSKDYYNRILSGEFLDPAKNLKLAQDLERGYQSASAWDSNAEAAGRYGSGAWGIGKGQQLADLQANLYGIGLNQMRSAADNASNIYSSQLLPGQVQAAVGQDQSNDAWNTLSKEASMLGITTDRTQPTYAGNKLMGGVSAVMGIIGTIYGKGGNVDPKTNTPGSNNNFEITDSGSRGFGALGGDNSGIDTSFGGYSF